MFINTTQVTINMKFAFFITLVFIAVKGLEAQVRDAFKYKAIYSLAYKPSKTDEQKKQEQLILLIGSQNTRFLSSGKYQKDSLLSNKEKLNLSFSEVLRNMPKTDFNYVIYQEIGRQKIVFKEKIGTGHVFSYEEDVKLDWEIYQDKKQLSGYSCQKAITRYAGRNYIAWFSSELPLSTDPYKFNGLPGLILEIFDDKKEYHFKLVQFNELSEEILFTDDKINQIKTDKNTFLKTMQKHDSNPFKTLEQSGISIDFPDDSKKMKMLKEHREKMSEKNPIELNDNINK